MGNALGLRGRRSVRVMTVDGATFKLRPPCAVRDAISGRGEGYAVMESEDVKRHGVKARRLDPDASLKPGKLYFLVHLPKQPPTAAAASASPGNLDQEPRRVRSAIQMSAKDRLESLMLARRATSDITSFTRVAAVQEDPRQVASGELGDGVRLKMRLPRAEVARIVRESADSAEAARRIAELARSKVSNDGAGGCGGGGGGGGDGDGGRSEPVSGSLSGNLSDSSSGNLTAPAGRKKKMRFSPLQPEIIG